jgi:hypothetical protein
MPEIAPVVLLGAAGLDNEFVHIQQRESWDQRLEVGRSEFEMRSEVATTSRVVKKRYAAASSAARRRPEITAQETGISAHPPSGQRS